MRVWSKTIVLQSGGSITVALALDERADVVDFWTGADGALVASINKLMRDYEKGSLPAQPVQTEKKLASTVNSDSPDFEKEEGGAR